jgi:hypothetical protein
MDGAERDMQQQQQWIGTTTNNAGAVTKGGWDMYSGCEVGKRKRQE